MTTNRKAVVIAFSLFNLGGCTTYSAQSVYPGYYEDAATRDGMPMNSANVPRDLRGSLPVEYQIAHYAGRLWCYVDWAAEATVPRFSSPSVTFKRSEGFQRAVESAIANPTREVAQPVGFPHVACLRPAGSIENVFDEQWFAGWLLYLSEWDSTQFSIEERQKSILEVQAKIGDLSSAINEADRQVKVLLQRTEVATASDKELDRQIALLKAEYDALLAGDKVNIQQQVVAPMPPFNPKIPYSLGRDPFADISAIHLKDISEIQDSSGDRWATGEMKGGKFVDPELFVVLENFHNEYLNPRQDTVPEILDIINELKSAGLATIRITSGVRSPYRQAHLVFEESANDNPVAQYVGSGHMFGQAVDIKLPKNNPQFSWGSPLHAKLRKLVTFYGLVFEVNRDKPHIALHKLSRSMLDRRLAIMRDYAARAEAVRAGQHILQTSQEAIFDDLKTQAELLSGDLKKRLEQVKEQTSIFGQMDAVLIRKRQELEGWREKTWRERQEQKRREQAQTKADADADRNSRRQSLGGDYGRAVNTPAPKSVPDIPKPPRPPKQPPEFECGGCGRIGKKPNT